MLKVPDNPPTGALGDEASEEDRPKKLDKSVALKSGRLVECEACGTVVWNAKKGKGSRKLHCPDCRTQKPFSESKLHVVKGELPKVVENPRYSRQKSRVPAFIFGAVLGAILAVGGAIATGSLLLPGNKGKSPDPFVAKKDKDKKDLDKKDQDKKNSDKKDDPSEPPKKDPKTKPDKTKGIIVDDGKAVREVPLVKTATGSYPVAQPEDFLMEGKVFFVLKVVDGDTMHIKELPNQAKVRLLGVDTPETKHATKGVQFWGKEASNFTKSLLDGKQVVLRIDEKNQYGVFGRPLVYIEMLDGRDFNGMLISEGYARCTREYPFNRMEEYKKLEDAAKAKQKGMWNEAKRAEFDRKKEAAKQAAIAAKQAAEARERGRREQLVKEAIAKGGRYIRAKTSKSVHEPWCKRLPTKNVLHFDKLSDALEPGCRKHSCFKK